MKSALYILLFVSVTAFASEPASQAPRAALKSTTANAAISESLRREGEAAVQRGLDWLAANQKEDGHWSNPEFPALTALPLWAMTRGDYMNTNAIANAVAYIIDSVREDGGIYRIPSKNRKGGGLSNYNTAVCMVALHSVGDPELVPIVQNARTFMAGRQHLGGDVYSGGMGYDADTGRPYTDLSNSYLAFEAMRLTESVEDQRTDDERADLDWEQAREFIERVHNNPDVNNASWVSDDPNEQGGFAYHPEQTRAGTPTNEQGVVKFRSMPGMTYAGLLSYIYANVDRTDPRVKATAEWIRRNWSLDAANRDPAKKGTDQEKEGLFYMYNVMSKGLAAYGQDVFIREDGSTLNWRKELIERLLSQQKTDEEGRGYWVNDNGRYWESDPALVTAYALLALEMALGN